MAFAGAAAACCLLALCLLLRPGDEAAPDPALNQTPEPSAPQSGSEAKASRQFPEIQYGSGAGGVAADIALPDGHFQEDLTQEELDEDYEMNTGKLIVEEFQARGIDPVAVPAVICHSHGPFTWGKDAAQAVYHAVVLEEVAKMAMFTRQVDPSAAPAPQRIQDKHYMRKHGPNAYYGQGKH